MAISCTSGRSLLRAATNILARARQPLLNARRDREGGGGHSGGLFGETSVRVKGKNWWEWVFVSTVAVFHVIRPSRGKAVVTALFGANRPEAWVSDMFPSQRGHGEAWRVCPAHLLRDAKYAIECGDHTVQRAVPLAAAAGYRDRAAAGNAERRYPEAISL